MAEESDQYIWRPKVGQALETILTHIRQHSRDYDVMMRACRHLPLI